MCRPTLDSSSPHYEPEFGRRLARVIYSVAKGIADGVYETNDPIIRKGHVLYTEYLDALQELVNLFKADGRFAATEK